MRVLRRCYTFLQPDSRKNKNNEVTTLSGACKLNSSRNTHAHFKFSCAWEYAGEIKCKLTVFLCRWDTSFRGRAGPMEAQSGSLGLSGSWVAGRLWLHCSSPEVLFSTVFVKAALYLCMPPAPVQLLMTCCLSLRKGEAELAVWLSAVPAEEGKSRLWNSKEVRVFATSNLVHSGRGQRRLSAEVLLYRWLLLDPEAAGTAWNHWMKAASEGCTSKKPALRGSAAGQIKQWVFQPCGNCSQPGSSGGFICELLLEFQFLREVSYNDKASYMSMVETLLAKNSLLLAILMASIMVLWKWFVLSVKQNHQIGLASDTESHTIPMGKETNWTQ